MFDPSVLRATLGRIDGRPFGAYRDLVGSYRLPEMVLHVDRVQPDPFAPPSRLRVTLPVAESGFADVAPSERLPLLDFLLRAFVAAAADIPDVRLPPVGPEVLERSALAWEGDQLELRFGVDLPAGERRVMGRQAMALLLRAVPAAALAALRRPAVDARRLRAHLAAYADDRRLRQILDERGWVAFVADGAILPRLRGGSAAPMAAARAVAFAAPESLAATVMLPEAGPVRGMPVPRGVTLIVGGGYHGKSTLLGALAAAVYPHVPGDGRERVAAVADACAVRVDEGRPVTGVDVAAFVQGVPGVPPGPFTSAAASGSTSQAAGIAEMLELGCTCLLIDEDTSAANFMARDSLMQALVPPAEEPIVPLVDRLQEMARHGVSTVLVAGGHGAFLGAADRVVRMRDFRAEDVTERARQVVAAAPGGRAGEAEAPWQPPAPRTPLAEAIPAAVRVRPRGRTALGWDEATVDLSTLPQLVDEGQTRAIADLLQLIGARYVDGRRGLAAVVAEAFAEIDRAGLAVISPWRGQSPGEYARPRPFEVAAAIDRLPTLAVRDAPPQPGAGRTHGERARVEVRRGSFGRGRETLGAVGGRPFGGGERRGPGSTWRPAGDADGPRQGDARRLVGGTPSVGGGRRGPGSTWRPAGDADGPRQGGGPRRGDARRAVGGTPSDGGGRRGPGSTWRPAGDADGPRPGDGPRRGDARRAVGGTPSVGGGRRGPGSSKRPAGDADGPRRGDARRAVGGAPSVGGGRRGPDSTRRPAGDADGPRQGGDPRRGDARRAVGGAPSVGGGRRGPGSTRGPAGDAEGPRPGGGRRAAGSREQVPRPARGGPAASARRKAPGRAAGDAASVKKPSEPGAPNGSAPAR